MEPMSVGFCQLTFSQMFGWLRSILKVTFSTTPGGSTVNEINIATVNDVIHLVLHNTGVMVKKLDFQSFFSVCNKEYTHFLKNNSKVYFMILLLLDIFFYFKKKRLFNASTVLFQMRLYISKCFFLKHIKLICKINLSYLIYCFINQPIKDILTCCFPYWTIITPYFGTVCKYITRRIVKFCRKKIY